MTAKSEPNHGNGFFKFEVLPSPNKSPIDKKEYKVIRLKNGLTACLVSYQHNKASPDQKMAAASLVVNVGSFSDPQSVPGMAHFLEHMVLMGSAKYPDETDFESFISGRGGSYNGETECESTRFNFECPQEHFKESLDRFAQFFISPLMKKDSVERVRGAIESEFNTCLTSDFDRHGQFMASFIKQNIPINTFTLGNNRTLKDNISEDELYQKLHEYRNRYYSAHQMTLAIEATFPIDVLEQLALENFDQIPTNNLPSDNLRRFTNIFETSAFTKLYHIDSVEENREVILTWILPCLYDKYKSKPHWYLDRLFEREDKGSLLFYLKNKAWASSLTAGLGSLTKRCITHNSLYALWPLKIVLTKEGLKHLDEVIETVFSYINMLRKVGPQENIFNEFRTIANSTFRFLHDIYEYHVVEELSKVMHLFPPEDYLTGNDYYFEYDPVAIQMIVDSLVPEKLNLIVRYIDLPEGISYDKEEKWFGTKYSEQEISEERMKRWEHAVPLSDFTLPPINQFLAQDFTILPDEENHSDFPQKILHTNLVELWHKTDQKFKLPCARYAISCVNPIVVQSAFNLMLMELYSDLFESLIKEELYLASSAEVWYFTYCNDEGITIVVNGYNEKLHLVWEVISKFIIEFGERLTQEIFDAVKENFIRDYYDSLLNPHRLTTEIKNDLLIHDYQSLMDKYKVSLIVTIDDIKQFAANFFRCCYIKSLVQGNVTKDQAINVVNTFVSKLNCTAFDYKISPKTRMAQIPKGENSCVVESLNKADSMSVVTNYYQLGPCCMRDILFVKILLTIIENPIIETLHTNEQLGNRADCYYENTSGILGFSITVDTQVTKYSTEYVNTRMDEFVKQIKELLNNMSVQEFQSIKDNFIKQKLCPDVNLTDEFHRNWVEIIEDFYMFDRKDKQIEQVKQLELGDLQNWWNSSSGNNFRKISVQVMGHDNISNDEKQDFDSKRSKHSIACEVSCILNRLFSGPELPIKLLENEEKSGCEANFIKDIKSYHNSLYLFPIIEDQ